MYFHQRSPCSCRRAAASRWTVLRPAGIHWNQQSGVMHIASRTVSFRIFKLMVILLDFVCTMVDLFLFLLSCLIISMMSSDARTLYPPQHTCINASCSRSRTGKLLKKEEQQQAVLYTLDKGALPARSVHLYCNGMYVLITRLYTFISDSYCLSRVPNQLPPQLPGWRWYPYPLQWNPYNHSDWGTPVCRETAYGALDFTNVGFLASWSIPATCSIKLC